MDQVQNKSPVPPSKWLRCAVAKSVSSHITANLTSCKGDGSASLSLTAKPTEDAFHVKRRETPGNDAAAPTHKVAVTMSPIRLISQPALMSGIGVKVEKRVNKCEDMK